MTDIEAPADLLRRVYDEEFGFLPTNASMKPVHVANGLCRRLLGEVHTHAPLAEVLRQYVDNQKGGFREERFPNTQILDRFGERFLDHFGNPPGDEQLTRFRSLAKDTLGADDAVFPTMASFTLSHRNMVTSDISDTGAGDFLAGLLLAGGALGRPTPAARHLVQLLEDDTDPWTTLAWPLLDLLEVRDASLAGLGLVRADRMSKLLACNAAGELEGPTLRSLRTSFDRLGRYEMVAASKLSTLRRMVLLGVFSIHVHMIRRGADTDSAASSPPILLDLFDGQRRSLRDASSATLQAGFRSIERTVVGRLKAWVDEAAKGDVPGLLAILPGDEQWNAVRAEYEDYLTSASPSDALAEACWKYATSKVGPQEVRGLPWNALLALGRRGGYLSPYDNRGRGGKEHKRYGANAEFAEVLVAATVEQGDPLDFDDFLDRLKSTFGIVVGRAADFDVIRRNDLRENTLLGRAVSVNEADLRANVAAFKEIIIDIGYGKSYADGRTIVTTDEAVA